MFRTFMRSKIHQARVTDANLNYVGSITIDEDIMDAVGIRVNEKVQVVNNNNGERIETYAIRGERGSKMICLNGAAARRFQVGDSVIIIAYGLVTEEEIEFHQPEIVILNEKNDIIEKRFGEIAGTMV
jgi:aspartate 1-decarboxylase